MSSAAAAAVDGVRPRSRPAVSARGYPARRRHSARRQQRRRDDAADHAVLRGAAGRTAGQLIVVDPRRTPTRRWATRHLPLRPGIGRGAGQRPAARARARQADRRGRTSATAPRTSTRRAAWPRPYWPERVERITGVPEGADRRDRAAARHGRRRDDSDRARPRAAGAGREQHARLHQPRARARQRRQAVQRLRHDDRSGQRPGRPRARPESRPAARLPARSTIPPRAQHIAGVWGVPASTIPGPGRVGLRADRLDRRPRTACARCSSWVRTSSVSAPDALRVGGGCGRSTSGRRRLLPVRNGDARRRRPAVGAMGRGGGHDDQPRGPRHSPAPCHRRRPMACGPISRSCAPSPPRSASGDTFPITERREVFDELRRATPGRPADYSGITYERIDAEDGVFWPCPSDRSSRHAALVRRIVSHAERPRAVSRRCPHQRAGRRSRRRVSAVPDDRPRARAYQSGTQTRRMPRASTDGAPEPLAEMHPATARRHRPGRRRRASRSRPGAAPATFTLKVTPTIREDTVFVPFHWGGEQSVNRLTSAALDPISRMPEFKVCAVRAHRRVAGDARMRCRNAVWWWSATAWPARASSKTCSRAAAATVSTSRCSATSRAATTTASCCRACSPAATIRATSSSTRLSWYAANGVTLHAGVRVEAIDSPRDRSIARSRRTVEAVRHARSSPRAAAR